MAHHPRVEELSDSDPEEMDPSEFEPDLVEASNSSLIHPSDILASSPSGQSLPFRPNASTVDQQNRSRSKSWQCLYPIYFDANRTRAEGRRVGKKLAVQNPLARGIVDAIQEMGLNLVFEPGKCHPKDWANPGRVRVLVKAEGKMATSVVDSKNHLLAKVAEYLASHPTDENSPMQLRIPGMPPPQTQPPPAPAIPRGWKLNNVLPLHSAAVTGGGVSENMFKDMMAEMQGQNGDGASAVGKAKKDKKKGKS